ncbi:hypothetical protein K6W16_24825 [Burkholderia dolosa]|uniref:hypothetical protein n=1 Tax=Burkholderia TaxID=32008 RepID=UPI0011B28418|nr:MULTISPECIES: hypothetical protein [Burkholderia]MBR8420979.1 hypothetical protein [Burkholderia dolosa]MBY4692198.1 hypothetical protein [Burkholderia dolosa]MBY4790367.1 hypothetical protein [Burkholderia dolosa]MBY4811633.1 hypothetical protein [Burkholderia dolosa]MBY4846213.1 hypothetical protein [Burkholderia dolosa]
MELTPQNNLGQHHAVGYLVDASSKSGGRRAIQPGVAENLVRASTGRDSYLGLRGNAGGASAQKKSVYNPLNRHGNAFAGIDQKTDWTRPGTVRSAASAAGLAPQAPRTQKKSVYNPLNRHGNAFAGIDQKTNWTRPGTVRSAASAAELAPQAPRTQKKSVYNPLNRHGNAFAGIDQKTDWTRPGVTRDVASLAEPVSARYRKQPECDRGGDDGYESDMEWDKSADYLPPFPSRRGASDEVDFVEGARIRADDHSLYAPVFAAVELGPSKR